ncbi:MAG: AbrB/MazE/SpoVT family DNA-binding domain-containing protein [Dehalococcoidia bacterium]
MAEDERPPRYRLKVDDGGRIGLPDEVRQQLAIRPGDFLSLHIEDGHIVVETSAKLWAELRAIYGQADTE